MSAWKEEFDLRQRIVNVAKQIGEEHLTRDEGPYLGGGNISARIPNTDMMLIKPTGYSIPKLKPEDLSLVKLDGKPVLCGKHNLLVSVSKLSIYQAVPFV